MGTKGEPVFSVTASFRLEDIQASSHFLRTSGRRLLSFLTSFPQKLSSVTAPVPPAAAATPAPAAAKTKETAPTAATDTTVAAAAFCAGGTHAVVVKLEFSCEGKGEEVADWVGVGLKKREEFGDGDAEEVEFC